MLKFITEYNAILGGYNLANTIFDCKNDANYNEYILKTADYLRCLKPGHVFKAFVKTYGCQQNVSDSEKYKGMLLEMGYQLTEDQNEADLILLNTCAVRENAENKVFGNLGWIKNIKKANPDLFVIICGCMTEQDDVIEKIKAVYPFVNLVFGTHSVHKFPGIFYKAFTALGKTKTYIKESLDVIPENIPMVRGNKLKAFVSIMYGCNNFCSYCIVPYVRGRERSRRPDEIVAEFKKLVDAGYKDITLLGQNVNSYGRGLDEQIDFPELLKKLDGIEGDYTIRFMTSHPKDASEKLFDVIANSKHIAHHIHLPVQCGSNRVLKAMNRKYTKEDYLKIINYARRVVPDITFTSDIIVGFPGETYEEFLETVDLIKTVKFSSLFTFIYSPRVGTPAAKMDDKISKKEKTNWLLELLKAQEQIGEHLCKEYVNKKVRVLVESQDDKKGFLICRTDGNIVVEAEGDVCNIGKFATAEITGHRRESLKGKLI